VLVGALAAFAVTGAVGTAPAAPPAAGPLSTQAAPPPTPPATTHSRPSTAPAAKKAKAASGPRYLCIYPGVGYRHIISPLPGGVTRARWATACRATDGTPAVRVSRSLFEEPGTHQYFKLQATSPDGFYVRLTTRP
jgi:hypothetical protein